MQRQQRYAPVGLCIYCGKAATSDEHIIARGLGGALVLPQASCDDCAKITSAVEDHCLAKMFGSARRQFGLPTYHKKRARPPRTLALDGVDVPIPDPDYSGLIVSLDFDAPSALGLSPPAPAVLTGRVAIGMLPEFGERLNRVRTGSQAVSFRNGLEAHLYGRMLAKIAHAYAVAELGLEGFKPRLLDIIREPEPPFIGRLVGGSLGHGGDGRDLHEIRVDDRVGPGLVVVQVRLFADRDLPSYWVVAGER
jgi:hypothetical protein